MRFRTLITLALVAIMAVAVAGCGSSKSTSSTATPAATESTGATDATSKSGGATVIELAADPSGQLKYDKTQLSAKPGAVTINLTNNSPIAHDVAVKDASGKNLGTSAKITKSKTTLTLQGVAAGTYTYYCTVPGHEAAGQKGTLTVK